MVMQQIDLFDQIKVTWLRERGNEGNPSTDYVEKTQIDRVEKTQNDETEKSIRIVLSSNLPYLPADGRNIAYKAAELMTEKYGGEETGRIVIDIQKRIPIAAGLAGGSADCAAVLHALNRIWRLKLDLGTLMELGTGLGADVPFCIAGQAALNEELNFRDDPMAGTCAVASGIGDKLEPVTPLNAWILLSKPTISLSTAQVYGGLRLQEITERPNTAELAAGLRERNFYKITKNMINVLENYSLKEYPIIMYTKNKIVQEGKAYKALMSGSGPTVFGVYTSKRKGTAAYKKLKTLNKEIFLIKTL